MSSESRSTRRLRMLLGGNAPGVEELDALLRGVDELRLTLETDLSLAASAVEAGAPGLAAQILDGDRDALARFEHDALGSLAALSAEPSRRSRLTHHAAPAVAAAALVAVLAGLMPQGLGGARPTDVTTSTVAATDSLAVLQDMVAQGDEQQIRIASATLHQQLASVVSQAKSDPLAAQQALLILSYEQSAIVSHGGSDALADVLVKSRQLAQAIRAALPKSVRTAVPVVPVEQPRAKATATPKATTSPKPASTTKPSAKPATSPSPSPSSSPSKDGGVIPPAPNLNGD
jgi:hypothetical protein